MTRTSEPLQSFRWVPRLHCSGVASSLWPVLVTQQSSAPYFHAFEAIVHSRQLTPLKASSILILDECVLQEAEEDGLTVIIESMAWAGPDALVLSCSLYGDASQEEEVRALSAYAYPL